MRARLRLLADDLTGALDSAAQFVALTGPVPTFWHDAMPSALPAVAALDSATREADAATAARRVAGLAPALGGAEIAFKKIDSLLRGHPAVEIAACLSGGGFGHGIIAPAFPAQGRVTRGGRQLVRIPDAGWRDVGVDLAAGLLGLGVAVRPVRPGERAPDGVSLWDAETDADLRLIAAAARALGEPVLWCGSGGLAAALVGPHPPPRPLLGLPLLGLFGSDHEVTMRQLEACGEHWLAVPPGQNGSPAAIQARLQTAGVALASVALPEGLSRAAAAAAIRAELTRLVAATPRPGTLLVAGGETLRSLCLALATDRLQVIGQLLPGVPVSLLQGGPWDGVTVVSKSGAFGEAGLLRELVGSEWE